MGICPWVTVRLVFDWPLNCSLPKNTFKDLCECIADISSPPRGDDVVLLDAQLIKSAGVSGRSFIPPMVWKLEPIVICMSCSDNESKTYLKVDDFPLWVRGKHSHNSSPRILQQSLLSVSVRHIFSFVFFEPLWMWTLSDATQLELNDSLVLSTSTSDHLDISDDIYGKRIQSLSQLRHHLIYSMVLSQGRICTSESQRVEGSNDIRGSRYYS